MNQINPQIKTTYASTPDVFTNLHERQYVLNQSERENFRNTIIQPILFQFSSSNGKYCTNTVFLRIDYIDNDSNSRLINGKFINQQTKDIQLLVRSINCIENIFKEYYDRWYNETKYLSSSKMFENKHYRDIISLGIDVVPSIINKIKEEPVHLFEALVEIIGNDPVPENHWGDAEQMARDWISWWEEKQRVQN